MRLIMNDRNLQTIEQVRQFLSREGGTWIQSAIYGREIRLDRGGDDKIIGSREMRKGVIRRYIERIMGYSRSQVSRLITEYKRRGPLKQMPYRRHRFPREYTSTDVILSAKTDLKYMGGGRLATSISACFPLWEGKFLPSLASLMFLCHFLS